MLDNSLPSMKIQSKINNHLSLIIWLVVLYICRDSSTDAERSLQIHPFLTNKANFQKSQMNVSYCFTMIYEQRTMNYEIKNKPNTKPIQTQFKPNSNPIQTQFKRLKIKMFKIGRRLQHTGMQIKKSLFRGYYLIFSSGSSVFMPI